MSIQRKHIFTLITLSVTLTLLGIFEANAQQSEYKVGSYNVRYDNAADREKGNGWPNRLPVVTSLIEGSMVNISVFDDDKCVGVGRIVEDNALKGMLTDVMVIREYQNKGVGKMIVLSLIKELYKLIKEGESFQLEASPTANNRDFYIKCGLKYKPENQDGVYLWIRKW